MPGAMITVADGIQRADFLSELVHTFVRHIPNRHAVGLVAQGIMIWHGTDAADDAGLQHVPQAAHDVIGGHTQLRGNGMIGLRHARQTLLGSHNNPAVDGVQQRRAALRAKGRGDLWCHASNLRPTKNSSCFGILCTG